MYSEAGGRATTLDSLSKRRNHVAARRRRSFDFFHRGSSVGVSGRVVRPSEWYPAIVVLVKFEVGISLSVVDRGVR